MKVKMKMKLPNSWPAWCTYADTLIDEVMLNTYKFFSLKQETAIAQCCSLDCRSTGRTINPALNCMIQTKSQSIRPGCPRLSQAQYSLSVHHRGLVHHSFHFDLYLKWKKKNQSRSTDKTPDNLPSPDFLRYQGDSDNTSSRSASKMSKIYELWDPTTACMEIGFPRGIRC